MNVLSASGNHGEEVPALSEELVRFVFVANPPDFHLPPAFRWSCHLFLLLTAV
jgi:hypothetical protein